MMRKKKKVRYLNGYRLLYRPNYPGTMTCSNWDGYVYEHRYVAAKMLGRDLVEGEDIHHLDGDRSNNDPSNILVLHHSQHTKLHNWLRGGAPGIERFRKNGVNSGKSKAKYRCKECGEVVLSKRGTSSPNKYCSQQCYIKDRRKSWPSKDKLQSLMKEHSFCEIGRIFSVSDSAVRKWAKAYNLL